MTFYNQASVWVTLLWLNWMNCSHIVIYLLLCNEVLCSTHCSQWECVHFFASMLSPVVSYPTIPCMHSYIHVVKVGPLIIYPSSVLTKFLLFWKSSGYGCPIQQILEWGVVLVKQSKEGRRRKHWLPCHVNPSRQTHTCKFSPRY